MGGYDPKFISLFNPFLIILLSIIWLFVLSGLLMWLWNITITRIFKVREITYWEAFRLILIAGILFGKGFINLKF